jgi:hypothetical protein
MDGGSGMLSGRRAAYFGSTVFVRIVVQSGSTLSVLLMAKFLGQEAVATYSICLAAVWLSSIVFANGSRIMMRRNFVLHPDTPPQAIYRRSQGTVLRSPVRYVLTAALLVFLAVYIAMTTGMKGVALMILMSPLFMLLFFLALKTEYHRAIGQTVKASAFEPGLLHLMISVMILTAVWAGVTDILSIFSVGSIVFLGIAVIAVRFVWRQTAEEEKMENSAAQRKILATNLLLFVFANGFPLFFAAFMIAADLGHFRIEERGKDVAVLSAIRGKGFWHRSAGGAGNVCGTIKPDAGWIYGIRLVRRSDPGHGASDAVLFHNLFQQPRPEPFGQPQRGNLEPSVRIGRFYCRSIYALPGAWTGRRANRVSVRRDRQQLLFRHGGAFRPACGTARPCVILRHCCLTGRRTAIYAIFTN